MSKNIVFEGWLTKSPPTKRIWRTKWRRRWFALRQSGELPGQYFLDYYADRNCRRPKGTINLDLCEQVDAGLHMERNGNGSLDPNLRGSVFTIQTQSRTYHLEADCEAEMSKWVDAICRVCGLRSTEEPAPPYEIDTYRSAIRGMSNMRVRNERGNSTGPYIPISECRTGHRSELHHIFSFDPKNIEENRKLAERVANYKCYRINWPDRPRSATSEIGSNVSGDERRSRSSRHPHTHRSKAKTLKKLPFNPNVNKIAEEPEEPAPPPVPPRPPKIFVQSADVQKDTFQGPKIQEPVEVPDNVIREPLRMSQAAPPSPGPATQSTATVHSTDDEDEYAPGQSSMQYCNLGAMPPAVDRTLKPRIATISQTVTQQQTWTIPQMLYVRTADTLQYSELDLDEAKSEFSKNMELPRERRSVTEPEPDYKTVDFEKTEAFNSVQQDAEALRSMGL